MILEMHSHTAEFSSCSHVAAVDLVRRACDLGLQGIVLTDHHHYWPPEKLLRLRRNTALPDHFVLFSGQEVTTFDVGDVLVYGADVTIQKGTPLNVIRTRFPEAAIVWAHPYRDEKHPAPEQLMNPLLDGVEIFNSNQTHLENSRGLHDWHQYRFTATGGTDTHAVNYTGTYPTLFDHPVASVTELAAELRRGRCRPFFKEVPHSGSNIQLAELTWGAPGSPRERIIVKEVKPEKWATADRSFISFPNCIDSAFRRTPSRCRSLWPAMRRPARWWNRGWADNPVRANCACRSGRRPGESRAGCGWLARLHGMRLQITAEEEFLSLEEALFTGYLAAFTTMEHRQTRRAREVLEHILQVERQLYFGHPERLVQGHGDFNPKNILIGRDAAGHSSVAAIDFDYSCCMPPALDVGTMLAQMRHEFFRHPEAMKKATEQLFFDAYRRAGGGDGALFPSRSNCFGRAPT